MIKFKFLGFPTVVHPFFWLVIGVLGMNQFSAGREGLIVALIWFFTAFISILWHELGHALSFKKYGSHSEITLYGFGGYCSPMGGGFSKKQYIEIIAAGPVFNFILAAAIYCLRYLPVDNPYLNHFIFVGVSINIFWGILNLIPIYPLDGGQILKTALPDRKELLVYWLGLILAVLMAILSLLTTRFFGLILFGLMAHENWQRIQRKKFLGY